MRRKRQRRENESFGLSFLDAICCGFGAIVLLLVITKTAEPTIVEDRGTGLEAQAEELADQLPDLEDQLESLETRLADRQQQLADARLRVAGLKPAAQAAEEKRAEARLEARAASTIEERLAVARQDLTAEMQRLYANTSAPPSSAVGGIPVDSEYIIFVIDTSGSMHRFAWPSVVRKLNETLDVYPKVRGIQVMSDMGDYMFSQYAGQWIPDTPGRRRVILERLAGWQPFSNSSPVEGITKAIRAFAAPDKRISIYVFGDEFTGSSIQSVLDTVRRINPKDARGRPRVRIHGLGFPVQFQGVRSVRATGLRFSILMRALCHENGGTFVGLNAL